MSGRYGNYSRSPSPSGRRERERFQTQDNFGRCVNLHKRSLPTLRETPLSPETMMWSLYFVGVYTRRGTRRVARGGCRRGCMNGRLWRISSTPGPPSPSSPPPLPHACPWSPSLVHFVYPSPRCLSLSAPLRHARVPPLHPSIHHPSNPSPPSTHH